MQAIKSQSFASGVLLGVALTIGIFIFAALVFLTWTDQYSLDHWKLNVRVPHAVGSLWMNLGFW